MGVVSIDTIEIPMSRIAAINPSSSAWSRSRPVRTVVPSGSGTTTRPSIQPDHGVRSSSPSTRTWTW